MELLAVPAAMRLSCMYPLIIRKFRTNIIQVCAFMFFAFAVQFLSGCGLMPNMETFMAALKDPQSVVGKYFEANPHTHLVATKDVEKYEELMSVLKKDPMAGMKTMINQMKQGVFVDLNEGINKEQSEAKLIFEVTEFKKYPATKDLFFKVRLFDKKYIDTAWWIYSTDFGKAANPTTAPVR